MNKERRLVIAFAASVLAAPRASLVQGQGRIWRIGYLTAGSPAPVDTGTRAAFLRGLRELGYVEGKNLIIEWRLADGKYERLPALAAELAQLPVSIIVAAGPPAVQAAKQATTTIPIVMLAGDPVGSGFVASLSRPGGNITGLSNITLDLSGKYLELLRAAIPQLLRVAVLVNPGHPMHPDFLKNIQAAAKTAGVKISPFEAKTASEIEGAFGAMTREGSGALIVLPDSIFTRQVRQIAELAVRHRLPSIFNQRIFPEVGGLMSYGQNQIEYYHRAATYVDKILKGAKPADLPVEQSTKVELVINRRTARSLGITIPQELLLRVDRVIE